MENNLILGDPLVTKLGVNIDEAGVQSAILTSYNQVTSGNFDGNYASVVRWIGMKYNYNSENQGLAILIHPAFLAIWHKQNNNPDVLRKIFEFT